MDQTRFTRTLVLYLSDLTRCSSTPLHRDDPHGRHQQHRAGAGAEGTGEVGWDVGSALPGDSHAQPVLGCQRGPAAAVPVPVPGGGCCCGGSPSSPRQAATGKMQEGSSTGSFTEEGAPSVRPHLALLRKHGQNLAGKKSAVSAAQVLPFSAPNRQTGSNQKQKMTQICKSLRERDYQQH